jgi:hypothetical protein
MRRLGPSAAEITIVLKIIVSGSETKVMVGDDETAQPLHAAFGDYAPTDDAVPNDRSHWRRRGAIVTVGGVVAAVGLLVGALNAPPQPGRKAVRAPAEAPESSGASNGATPSSQAILAGLDPDEQRYVAGVVALTQDQLRAGFGNVPVTPTGAADRDGADGSCPVSSARRADVALQP